MKPFAHEHENLRKLVNVFKQAVMESTPCKITHSAERLYLAISDHMQDEEAPNGFFREIEEADPRMLPAVEQMRLQHQEIRRLLEQIIRRAEMEKEQLIPLIDQFFAIFVRHEATEEKLSQEFYYQDQVLGA